MVAKFFNKYKYFFQQKGKKSFYCSNLKESLLHQDWTKFSFVKKEKNFISRFGRNFILEKLKKRISVKFKDILLL